MQRGHRQNTRAVWWIQSYNSGDGWDKSSCKSVLFAFAYIRMMKKDTKKDEGQEKGRKQERNKGK